MTITNQYLHADEIDRLHYIQQINRRCIRILHSAHQDNRSTIVVAAHPSLVSLKREV